MSTAAAAVPDHLTPEAVKEALEEEQKTPDQKTEEKLLDNPKSKEVYEFDLDYTDARGKKWEGRFITKILDQTTRGLASVLQARLAGSSPYDSLNPLAREMTIVRSHIAYSLTKRPKWAEGEKLDNILDPGVLQAIFTEVASHESFFLGWGDDASESGEKSS